jgi:methyltransferase-like protein 6
LIAMIHLSKGLIFACLLCKKKPFFSLSPRELTLREVEILKTDNKLIPNFWKNKFEKDCAKNWNIFYKRNRSNFFKDRHWITKEFSDLFDKSDEKKVIFEVGCGVGNTIFPLLEYNLNLSVHCCDFSPRAVEILKENALYDEQKVNAFVLDLTISPSRLTNFIAESSVDVVTMFFVLSAIPPLEMRKALQPIYQVLKPGGTVVFRDYGIYDHAMLRFKQGHKLSDNLYVRQDGTLAYYFSLGCFCRINFLTHLVFNCCRISSGTV